MAEAQRLPGARGAGSAAGGSSSGGSGLLQPRNQFVPALRGAPSSMKKMVATFRV